MRRSKEASRGPGKKETMMTESPSPDDDPTEVDPDVSPFEVPETELIPADPAPSEAPADG
jgi:hypothetical protein